MARKKAADREMRYPQQMIVRVTKEMHEAILAVSDEQDRTMAQTVRRAMAAYLDGEWR